MSEGGRITGSVVLKLRDQLLIQLYLAPGQLKIYTPLFLVFFFPMVAWSWWRYYEICHCDLSTLFHEVVRAAPAWLKIYLIYVAFCGATTFMFAFVRYWRLPRVHLALTYEIDDEKYTTKDEAGVSQEMPWSSVAYMTRFCDLLVLRLKARQWRYIPLRAFSTVDQEALIHFVAAKVAKKVSF